MRIAPLFFAVVTVIIALVAFGGAEGAFSSVARLLFPIFFILFIGSIALPTFRPHQ